MEFNGLQLTDINGKAANFGVFNNAITTSSIEGEAFSLVFRATEAGQLSDMINLSSARTAAEAYTNNGEVMDVELRFDNGLANAAEFAVYQNQPNPVATVTEIRFNLPAAAQANISISDVTGKVVRSINGDYAKGLNMVRVSAEDLPAGVLYYTIQSSEFSATKKMVVTK